MMEVGKQRGHPTHELNHSSLPHTYSIVERQKTSRKDTHEQKYEKKKEIMRQ